MAARASPLAALTPHSYFLAIPAEAPYFVQLTIIRNVDPLVMTRLPVFSGLAALALSASAVSPVALADEPTFELTISDHRFQPETLNVPANVRIKLVIQNADPTPEEFESYELNREKVISGNSKATVYIGPLEPGTYSFFGEFHEDTAKGSIVAK